MNTETTRTIVVLDDGETFGGADGATLNVISHEQHEELCDGGDFADLSGTPASTYNIAALPDLLEALFEVHQWSRRAEREKQQNGPVLKDYLWHAAEAARAAIAKATGGEA